MGLITPKEWSYPNVDDTEGILQYLRDHHREHMEFEARRVRELSEFDHYKYMLSAYLSATQSNLVDNTWTTIGLDTELIDTGGRFDTTTFTYTAPLLRRYAIAGSIAFLNCVANTWYSGRIRKNGTTSVAFNNAFTDGNGEASVQMSNLVELDVGDTLLLQALSNSGDNTVDVYGSDVFIYTYMTVYIIG